MYDKAKLDANEIIIIDTRYSDAWNTKGFIEY
jgi:hypothetical protein